MRTIKATPKYFICSLASQAVRKMLGYYNRAFEPMGLTAQQVMSMGVLWREGEMGLGEFAAHAGIGKAAAVTMIQRLEAMGLVARMPHPTDARKNVLQLTFRAKALAPRLIEKGLSLEKSIEDAIGRENMDSLINGLSTICDLDLGGLLHGKKP